MNPAEGLVPSSRSRPQRGRPFAKGNSGRRPGSKNKSTLMAEALLRGEGVELVHKGLELAKAGDVTMLKFFLERLLPKERPVQIAMPEINSGCDVIAAWPAVLRALAAGEIAPGEAAKIASTMGRFMQFLDIETFDKRMRELETKLMELVPK